MKTVVLQQNYKLNMAGEVCGFEDAEAQRLVDSGAAVFHAPTHALARGKMKRKVHIALKAFQFLGERVKEGDELDLTAAEAEKLGPERVILAP